MPEATKTTGTKDQEMTKKVAEPTDSERNTEQFPMDKNLLDILACPICKGPLFLDKNNEELICRIDRVAYAIRDNIPIMLEGEARELTLNEVEASRQENKVGKITP